MISKTTKELLESGALASNKIEVTNNNKIKINTGIIVNNFGQSEISKAENRGIIVAKDRGQYVWGSSLYNYGLIILGNGTEGEGGGQTLWSGANCNIENYGIIFSNASGGGQTIASGTKNGKIYNYGYIQTKNSGQTLHSGNTNVVYNYGVINSTNGNGQEIKTKASNSEIRNYGLITANKFAQSVTGETNSAYNYGIIKGSNTSLIEVKDNAKAYNEGVIINESGTGIYSNDVNNKENVVNNSMIVIDNTKGNITDNFINNGVVLNSSFEVVDKDNKDGINKNVVEFKNKQEITNSTVGGAETGKTSGYIKNGSVTIAESLTNKNLNAVVTNNSNFTKDKAIFTYENTNNKNLILTNTNIIGYFQKAGTLLDIKSGEIFTIAGDTLISAIKDDKAKLTSNDVTAVKLAEGTTLRVIGEAEIIGKIIEENKGEGDKGALFWITAGNDGKDGENYKAKIEENREVTTIRITNADQDLIEAQAIKAENNYTNVEFKNITTDNFEVNFGLTAEDEVNRIVLGENVVIKNGINGANITEGNDLELQISEITNIGGDIKLGASDDSIRVTSNKGYNHTIDMGAGDDTLSLSVSSADRGNIFDYNVMNTEKLNLTDGNWYIGKGKLGFSNSSKANNQTSLNVTNGRLYVEMNNNTGKVTTDLDNIVDKGTDFTVSATKGVKYILGKDFNVGVGDKFVIDTNYKLGEYTTKVEEDGRKTEVTKTTEVYGASIFNTEVDKNGDVVLSVKEASEIKNKDGETLANYKGVYDAMLGYISKDDNLRYIVNYSNANELIEEVKKVDTTASAFYTTGYAVTKDVTDTYMSIVDDFGRKAGAGEWIAYGKYVNSDTEFDGGKASKGYDGDITGTVGMIEYGVNDTTSYGAVFGKGDTKVDINGGGKLDGDNTYAGLYMKHKTQTGIDLTANVGYTKSDLDLNLATSASNYNMITDGSSDSTALTFALKGTKDYKLSESMRLQPVVSARYSLINQDAVESKDANFRIDEQDVTIFEGAFGGNVIKDFDVYNGTLSLKAGAEFVLTEVSKSDDGRYTLYGKDITLIDEEDIADNRIRTHVGAEYIHENGVGIDAKYEMIFTDKGDTDRITAGVSYKF